MRGSCSPVPDHQPQLLTLPKYQLQTSPTHTFLQEYITTNHIGLAHLIVPAWKIGSNPVAEKKRLLWEQKKGWTNSNQPLYHVVNKKILWIHPFYSHSLELVYKLSCKGRPLRTMWLAGSVLQSQLCIAPPQAVEPSIGPVQWWWRKSCYMNSHIMWLAPHYDLPMSKAL